MISLNGIELDPYLQVPDWYTASGAMGSDRGPTLGGRLVSQRLVGVSFKRITLTAKLDGTRVLGHFKRQQVQSIRAMADLGNPVEFIYHDNVATVTVAIDGLDVVMIGDRTDPTVDHPYVGTITLLMRN